MEPSKVPADRLAHSYRWKDDRWNEQPLFLDGAFAAMGELVLARGVADCRCLPSKCRAAPADSSMRMRLACNSVQPFELTSVNDVLTRQSLSRPAGLPTFRWGTP
jgi:hypothetical protein